MSQAYFTTASGHRGYVLEPRKSHIAFTDIAIALARLPRYGCMYDAAIVRPYTVAQHSVLTSERVSPENALEALLHDATEAYLGDIISPLKACLPDYKGIEREWAIEIGSRAGLGARLAYLSEEVKAADHHMLLSEMAVLKTANPDGETRIQHPNLTPIPEIWTELEARQRFMARFLELTLAR